MASIGDRIRRANVIGAGPNGLAAAVTLAQAGLAVEVFEAETQPGGAARTMELTLPGFHHDFGSSVYPMGAGSPFFRTLAAGGVGPGMDPWRCLRGASAGRRNRGCAGAHAEGPGARAGRRRARMERSDAASGRALVGLCR